MKLIELFPLAHPASKCNVGESYCIYILLSMQGKKKVEYFALKNCIKEGYYIFLHGKSL